MEDIINEALTFAFIVFVASVKMGDVHRSKCKMHSPGGSHEQLIILLIVHANVNLSDETPQVFL